MSAKTGPRVLVIYKKTTFQRYRGGQRGRLKRLIDSGDPAVRRIVSAHEAHLDTLAKAKAAFRELGVRATFRHHYEPVDHSWDLVVTLGGDGTLLWASHMVDGETPIVAINSAPHASVGYFCAGDREDVAETLELALGRELKTTRLTRMQVDVDDECVSTRVLNDILFCHECPAATSRYLIRHGDTEEEQTSSGMWAGPAAGSTAAQRSAGGKVLAIGSRRIQYVVREPYQAPGVHYSLARGLVDPGEELVLRSKMREGIIYVDGAHRTHPVDIGAELRLKRSPEVLQLLGLRSRQR